MRNLKITVIGATGGTGEAIVANALSCGCEVVAVARRPERLKLSHARLFLRQGNVSKPETIYEAVNGADAVVSVIGTKRSKEPTRFYSDGIANVISAIERCGGRRLISVGASGYIDSPAHPAWLRFMMKNLVQKILFHNYEDMMRMEESIKQSELDWTIVRPPRLTNGRRTESYRVQKEVVIGGSKISRADVADYIVKSLTDKQTFQTAFGVAD